MTGDPIRVAIVDDQALVRSGLHALLNRDLRIRVVHCLADGPSLLAALPAKPVDVVLADVRMPGMDGLALVSELQKSCTPTATLLLTTFDDEDLPLRAAEHGARGFLLKDASPQQLVDAIVRVHVGETVFAPVAVDAVRHRLKVEAAGGTDLSLNTREVAILRLLAGGYSNKEIARTIHLSEGTVKNYVSEILLKLGVRDRTRAVLKAITRHVI